MLVGVMSVDSSHRSQAQVIDCNNFCWTLPCYFYCAPAIRAIYPRPLALPLPTNDMWESPETVVITH
jgi:hypothetical protein